MKLRILKKILQIVSICGKIQAVMIMENIYRYNDDYINWFHRYDARPNPADFYMHVHERYEILHFISGKGKQHVEGSEYPLNDGDILIMRHTEAHYIEIDPSQPYERLAIHFDTELLKDIDPDGHLLMPFRDREQGKYNLFTPAVFPNDNYLMYLRAITTAAEDQRLQVVTNLLALLNELYNVAVKREESIGNETTAYKIVRYVNAHISEELSLENICNQFFISKPQLCRLFKRATGSTVWNYITIKRLLLAERLIKRGTPVIRAASMCGFGDYSSFYRAYRKHFGKSPNSTTHTEEAD